MKRIFSFIILIFLIHGVAIRAFTPRRGPDHALNFELLPLEENVLDIEEANLTLDFRNLEKDDDYAKVDFLAEYRINNPGITQKHRFALPFAADSEQAGDTVPEKIEVNGTEVESKLYFGNESGPLHGHDEQVVFDFYEEFLNATPEDHQLPELNGSLYTFTHHESVDVQVDLEFPEGTKIFYYGVYFHSESSTKARIEHRNGSEFSFFVLGEVTNVTSSYYKDYEKRETGFFDYLQEYMSEEELSMVAFKHKLKSFLESGSAGQQVSYLRPGFGISLCFHVFEALLNNGENNIKIAYRMEIYRDDDYRPDIYELRYLTHPMNYWRNFKNLKIRIHPGPETKHLLQDPFDFQKEDDYWEKQFEAPPEDILLRFSKNSKPINTGDVFFFFLRVLLLFIISLPVLIFLLIGVVVFIYVRKKQTAYKNK